MAMSVRKIPSSQKNHGLKSGAVASSSPRRTTTTSSTANKLFQEQTSPTNNVFQEQTYYSERWRVCLYDPNRIPILLDVWWRNPHERDEAVGELEDIVPEFFLDGSLCAYRREKTASAVVCCGSVVLDDHSSVARTSSGGRVRSSWQSPTAIKASVCSTRAHWQRDGTVPSGEAASCLFPKGATRTRVSSSPPPKGGANKASNSAGEGENSGATKSSTDFTVFEKLLRHTDIFLSSPWAIIQRFPGHSGFEDLLDYSFRHQGAHLWHFLRDAAFATRTKCVPGEPRPGCTSSIFLPRQCYRQKTFEILMSDVSADKMTPRLAGRACGKKSQPGRQFTL